MLPSDYMVNYVFSLVYALAAWVALGYVVLMPAQGKFNDRQPALRVASTFSLALYALGTGLDNSRAFAGSRAVTWPDGIWECQSATVANELVAKGVTKLAYAPMIGLTNICFILHEFVGACFIIPGLYLWAVSRRVRSPTKEVRKCCTPCSCCNGFGMFLEARVTLITFMLTAIVAIIGLIGFIAFTARHGYALKYNASLGGWALTGAGSNPLGLVGVFASSFVWIFTGVWVARSHGNYWFVVIQVACFLLQAGSAGLKDYMQVLSNLLEQVSLYALIALAAWLRRLEVTDDNHVRLAVPAQTDA